MRGGLRVDARALERLSPQERDAVADQLRVVEEAYKQNPLLGYHPHGRQRTFHSQPSPRRRLFIGGNRSGKTTATHVDTILQCIDHEAVPEHLRGYKRWEPPFYARIVGPDLTRWLEGVAMQKFREWCPKGQLKGSSFDRAWDKQQIMLRFKNGSWVQFMSNDQDLDKFAGAALHRVVYDESPRQDIRRECLMRLIDYGGEEMYGLTPMDGMSNWLYDDFYTPWEMANERVLTPTEREKLLGYRLELVDMDDNPHLTEEDKEWSLAGLNPEERDARKSGRFVAFQGLIYPEWSTDKIIPEPDSIPKGVEVFCGIDPGYRHMCAVLFAYLDSDDDLVVFDEIAAPKTLISDVCKMIHERNQRWGIQPNWYVIDPAARNKNGQTGRSDQQEFWDNQIPTIPGQNARRPGINRVKERIAADKLKIAASCPELLSEFKKYRWVKTSNRTENDAPDEPVKKDDHALDVLRYIVMARPLAPPKELVRPSDTWKDRALRNALKRLRVPSQPDHASGPGIWQ